MNTTSKSKLIHQIRQERAQWDELLAAVGTERMINPEFAGGWSFKDLMTHIMAWREREMAYLEAAQQGLDPAPPAWWHDLGEGATTDQINQWIYDRDHNRSLDEVIQASRQQFMRLETLVDSLSEKELTDPRRFAWMQGKPLGPTVIADCFDHFHEEHEPEIRTWLATIERRYA
jgi:hypothetical protein